MPTTTRSEKLDLRLTPSAKRVLQFCKHIWAAILAADQARALDAPPLT